MKKSEKRCLIEAAIGLTGILIGLTIAVMTIVG